MTKTISQLLVDHAMDETNLAAADVLEVEDVSAGQNGGIRYDDLRQAILLNDSTFGTAVSTTSAVAGALTDITTLQSQIATLAAVGGIVYETHSTTTVTNTTASATLKSMAANAAIPTVEGDRIVGTFHGSAFNTSGVTHSIQPIFKIGANNIMTDDATNYPMNITSAANKVRSWTFQFEIVIGATSTTHRQSSYWLMSQPAGSSASATTGSSNWAPPEPGFPMYSTTVSATTDIGTTLPLIDLRVGYDVALTTLSMSCHFAQIALLKKP